MSAPMLTDSVDVGLHACAGYHGQALERQLQEGAAGRKVITSPEDRELDQAQPCADESGPECLGMAL